MSLIVIAGPAGVGKGTLVRWLLENDKRFTLSVSATTRSPRPGETDGKDYWFLDRAGFEELIADNQLLEWAVVHGDNYYGTPLNELTRAEANDQHLLLEIDIQGSRQISERIPAAIKIFIQPPSWEELETRLRKRATETESQIQTRLETARAELMASAEFDFQVINDDLAAAGKKIVEIISEAEELR